MMSKWFSPSNRCLKSTNNCSIWTTSMMKLIHGHNERDVYTNDELPHSSPGSLVLTVRTLLRIPASEDGFMPQNSICNSLILVVIFICWCKVLLSLGSGDWSSGPPAQSRRCPSTRGWWGIWQWAWVTPGWDETSPSWASPHPSCFLFEHQKNVVCTLNFNDICSLPLSAFQFQQNKEA